MFELRQPIPTQVKKETMTRKLITSALPYINGIKHLGNLVGSMLPADIMARFLRQQGEEVLYICGTDDHGAPAELGALKQGQTVEDYCEQSYVIQKKIYEDFNLSFDYFGRTSSETNKAVTQEIFTAIAQNGYIFEDTIKQFYSEADQRFLADRYIEGECPKCGFADARGDQCDGCGSLLNPTDLIEPRSALSGSKALEITETRHLFLNLEQLTERVEQWINKHPHWPSTVSGIAHKWLKEGLKPRCITRDLSWGVPVPKTGFEDKVFYVWFDAPIGYISMTKEWAAQQGDPDAWQQWWQRPEDVTLIQFMAKDNVPFHTVFWPAMMMGTEQNWVYAHQIKGVNWLTYEGDKFSTSRQKGVFTDKALSLFPADYWRYCLFAMMPETNDADFSFAAMAQIINKDLADSLGNFNSRVCKLIEKNYASTLPEGFSPDPTLIEEITDLVKTYESHMHAIEFRKAGVTLRKMWALGNEYVHKNEPWKVVKSDLAQAANILKNSLYLLNIYSCALAPIAPDTAKAIRQQLPVDPADIPPAHTALASDWLEPSVAIQPNKAALIQKIAQETIESLTEQFAGTATT